MSDNPDWIREQIRHCEYMIDWWRKKLGKHRKDLEDAEGKEGKDGQTHFGGI